MADVDAQSAACPAVPADLRGIGVFAQRLEGHPRLAHLRAGTFKVRRVYAELRRHEPDIAKNTTKFEADDEHGSLAGTTAVTVSIFGSPTPARIMRRLRGGATFKLVQRQAKRMRIARRVRYFDTPRNGAEDAQRHTPCLQPRIAFRDITNRTNLRTLIASLNSTDRGSCPIGTLGTLADPDDPVSR